MAFAVMRALVTARLLWARSGGLPIAALPALVDAPPDKVALAVDRLSEECVVEVSAHDQTVRLTERAAGEIFRRCGVEPVIRLSA